MLTGKDKAFIADAITDAINLQLSQQINNVPVTKAPNVQEQDADQSTSSFYAAEAALIQELSNPRIVLYRTKRGVTKVNETVESLNALYDLGRDRKIWTMSGRMK